MIVSWQEYGLFFGFIGTFFRLPKRSCLSFVPITVIEASTVPGLIQLVAKVPIGLITIAVQGSPDRVVAVPGSSGPGPEQ